MQSNGSTCADGMLTVIVPVFVPLFELTVMVPLCVASHVSPVVSIVTVTVSVSVVVDPLAGLTVIHGRLSLAVHVSVPPPQLVTSNVHVRVSPSGTLPKLCDGGSGLVQSTGSVTSPTVKVPFIAGMVPRILSVFDISILDNSIG